MPAAASRDRKIAYLDAAVSYEPADGALHIALADTHFLAWQEGAAGSDAAHAHAAEAARHYPLARSLRPLLRQPQVRRATLPGSLAAPHSRATYLPTPPRVLPD